MERLRIEDEEEVDEEGVGLALAAEEDALVIIVVVVVVFEVVPKTTLPPFVFFGFRPNATPDPQLYTCPISFTTADILYPATHL